MEVARSWLRSRPCRELDRTSSEWPLSTLWSAAVWLSPVGAPRRTVGRRLGWTARPSPGFPDSTAMCRLSWPVQPSQHRSSRRWFATEDSSGPDCTAQSCAAMGLSNRDLDRRTHETVELVRALVAGGRPTAPVPVWYARARCVVRQTVGSDRHRPAARRRGRRALLRPDRRSAHRPRCSRSPGSATTPP